MTARTLPHNIFAVVQNGNRPPAPKQAAYKVHWSERRITPNLVAVYPLTTYGTHWNLQSACVWLLVERGSKQLLCRPFAVYFTQGSHHVLPRSTSAVVDGLWIITQSLGIPALRRCDFSVGCAGPRPPVIPRLGRLHATFPFHTIAGNHQAHGRRARCCHVNPTGQPTLKSHHQRAVIARL